ncbi:hypothetical protein FGE12_00580 [Aggregicoccus sp. 17bor-14]|uniref:hypothetical protein n=1 Tax=Myxococcaceae TaxID=31 RepID=UPI00129C57D2|nr:MULTISPECIES: hypothetical protein [Myxococcaceae]MBF5040867.1 hypothetical protein [Simulacricoccus sp. 17bor-14]MRI86656.1 hypothetical protein [Aggregicoccus sp. 17bor-14]
MDAALLQKLGLAWEAEEGGGEAVLELHSLPLVNPLTRHFIDQVRLRPEGEGAQGALLPVAPAEVRGLAPVPLAGVERSADLEAQVSALFNAAILSMQRRSAELQVLGVTPRVDPDSLELSAELDAVVAVEGTGGRGRALLQLTLTADRQGQFRLTRAERDGATLDIPEAAAAPFDLSEFREKSALVGYLAALVGEELAPQTASPREAAEPQEAPLRYSELVATFGAGLIVPPRSALELLAEVVVEGKTYRFAAARVAGRSFRGLLAGAQGKLWAERFELEEFPGVVALVSRLLHVPPEAVQVVGGEAAPHSEGE